MQTAIVSSAALAALAFFSVATASVHAASSKASEGEAIYEDNCARCHGDALKNTSGGVTFDLRRLRPDEHDRFVHSVLNGKRDMPPWRGALDDNQIEAIWAYVRATVDR
jgi:mono/diheme cytochrome c family protein